MPTPDSAAEVVDLAGYRAARDYVVAELAAAPVKHVPAELLEALLGSWGTPGELGVAPAPARHLRVVGG